MQHQMFISTTRIIAQYLLRLLFHKEYNRFLNLLFSSLTFKIYYSSNNNQQYSNYF